MKLVREHINEKFVEESDPIKDMGIGSLKVFQDKLPSWDLKSMTPNQILVKCITYRADDDDAAVELANFAIKKLGADQLWYNPEEMRVGNLLKEIVKVIAFSKDYNGFSCRYETVWSRYHGKVGNKHTLKNFQSEFYTLDNDFLKEVNDIIVNAQDTKKILAKFGVK